MILVHYGFVFLDIFLHCEKHVFKTRPVGNGFTWSTHLIHSKNLYLPKKNNFSDKKNLRSFERTDHPA